MAKINLNNVPMAFINKLPKAISGGIDPDDVSLAVDIWEGLGVIEITNCWDDKLKTICDPLVRALVLRSQTYVEEIPRCEGIRIIGIAWGGSVELNAAGDEADRTISIYRNADRYIDISGIPIVGETELRRIDDVIDELMAKVRPSLHLWGRRAVEGFDLRPPPKRKSRRRS